MWHGSLDYGYARIPRLWLNAVCIASLALRMMKSTTWMGVKTMSKRSLIHGKDCEKKRS